MKVAKLNIFTANYGYQYQTVYLIKSYLLRSEVGSRINLRYDDIVVGGRHCYSKNEVMTKFNGYKVIEYQPPVKNSRRVVLL